ncbi:MAG: 6-bladed beta-propeller [Balneolaceae bacterium]|nr:6-bladed beta-propeller [Balneolaceae bacterium]
MSQFLFKVGFFIITAVMFIISCTTAENEMVSENPFDGVPEIEISESLDITDEAESHSSAFYFTSKYFHHMLIDNRGHFFIYNRGSEPIYHFDDNGVFIATIGRRGQGPGEFQSWPTFDAISSDTLYTMDRIARIVTRFVYSNGEWAYDNSFTVSDKEQYSPNKILQVDNEHLVIEYSPDLSRLMNQSDNSSQATKKYDLINTTGELIQENWLETPVHDRSIYSSSNGARATHMLPFGGRSIMNIGPNSNLYHLWSPEFIIDIYDLDGSKINSLQQPSYNYSLSSEIRQKWVDEAVGVRMGSEREQQELVKQMFDETPETAPALRDIHVDRDKENIIVRRYIFEDQANWMLLDYEGNRVGVFTLDENLNVFGFRNGKIIGALNKKDELPTVRIVTLPQSVL